MHLTCHHLLIIIILPLITWQCGSTEAPLFVKVDQAASGLDFNNVVTINDTLNILTTEFVYNGGGVAVGDLNSDGWPDVFFTGNQVDNRLFINRGALKFDDVTTAAKVNKSNPSWWSSGVSIVDVNADGRLDIYVCNTFQKRASLRPNLLYINQGNDDLGIPIFLEQGKAYGLADTSHSSHAQFFDYDNDGDLDVFIGVNWIEGRYPNTFEPLKTDGSAANRDLLYRNDWNDALGHPVFVDVSLEAGLVQDGYSHSTLIHDFNADGWQDIYVANDYFSNDLIFINNRDGTFTNRARDLFKHFSLSAMGSDVADINNDGLADVFTSEMQPYYNKRKKLFQGESNYQNTVNTIVYDYEFQYTRNTLQLNLGTNPRTKLPQFAEIGLYAGVMETDWSWTGLFADFDNDGWKDLFVSNGFPKDVTDRDFSDFRAEVGHLVTQEQLYAAIPEVKSPNFIFRNQGDLTFENRAESWGIDLPSFSYGAAYADLDQDGDLDLVTNNLNDTAFLFENKANSRPATHYLRVQLIGPVNNRAAIGSRVIVKVDSLTQVFDMISGRGYLSQSELVAHFGLNALTLVDTMAIIWPDGQRSTLANIDVDQTMTIYYDRIEKEMWSRVEESVVSMFDNVAEAYGLLHYDQDRDFIDFNIQRTLPHKFSQYGPALAVGDINGDALDDVIIGAGRNRMEVMLIQDSLRFNQQVTSFKTDSEMREEDAGILLFDADSDGDLDLYLARGSAQDPAQDPLYQDVIYANDGTGNYTLIPNALPTLRANGSCVKAADYDGDGDLDLFVGSRVLPRAYPLPDRSYILENQSTENRIEFSDVTPEQAPDLMHAGLISDALWTDFDGDNDPDLLLAGEWMPLTLFENHQGSFVDATSHSGIQDVRGWWNSLTGADLDNDGDMDYVAGNFGKNLYFQCSTDRPLTIYAKDLDANGSIDPLISCHWQDSLGDLHEFLYHPRQDLIKQFVGIRKKFNTYGAFGEATVPEMFDEEEMSDALIMRANLLASCVFENLGGGRFRHHELPASAQLAPVYGSLAKDLNADGWLDLVLVGNDHGMEVQQGRADAFNGLVLLGDGNFTFRPLGLQESNFVVSKDARALATIQVRGTELLMATQNKDSLVVHRLREEQASDVIQVPSKAVKSLSLLENGLTRLDEWYYGSGFMSQSSRSILLDRSIESITFIDHAGEILSTHNNGHVQ